MKHFNAGNVWGRVLELKQESSTNGTPYLMISLDCAGKHGTVRAYGRLFGKEKTENLVDFHEDHPGAMLRFRGYVGQYTKEGTADILTNFTFYAWEEAPGQTARAAFVLVGEVTDIAAIGDRWRVNLHLSREGKGNRDNQEEDFCLWGIDGSLFEGMLKGQLVELKGYMQQGEGEDDFGTASGEVLPIVKRSRIVVGF